MADLSLFLETVSEHCTGAPERYRNRLPARIEMIDRQRELRRGILYIGTKDGFEQRARVQDALHEKGTLVFLAEDADGKGRLLCPGDCDVFSFSLPLTTLYNTVAAWLRTHEDEQPSDSQKAEQDAKVRSLIHDILENRLTSDADIRTALRKLSLREDNFMRILLISFSGSEADISYRQFITQLHQLFPKTAITDYRGDVVMLFGHEQRLFHLPTQDLLLTELLEEYDAYLLISNASRRLDAFAELYLLSKRTAELAVRLRHDHKERIFHFEDYSVYCVIDLSIKHYLASGENRDIIYLAHPAIISLTRYDRQHDTNLRDVLYYYLINDRNLVKTAAVLYMHRNTVINKVKQINELIGLDLEDAQRRQRLIFSCQLLRYYEIILKQYVRP